MEGFPENSSSPQNIDLPLEANRVAIKSSNVIVSTERAGTDVNNHTIEIMIIRQIAMKFISLDLLLLFFMQAQLLSRSLAMCKNLYPVPRTPLRII